MNRRTLIIRLVADPILQAEYTIADRVENSRLRTAALWWSHRGHGWSMLAVAGAAGAELLALHTDPACVLALAALVLSGVKCVADVAHYVSDCEGHDCPHCPDGDGPGDGGDGPDPEPDELPDDPHGRIVDLLTADLDQQWAALSDAARDGAFR